MLVFRKEKLYECIPGTEERDKVINSYGCTSWAQDCNGREVIFHPKFKQLVCYDKDGCWYAIKREWCEVVGEVMEPYDHRKARLFTACRQAYNKYQKAKDQYRKAQCDWAHTRYCAGKYIGLYDLIEDLGLVDEFESWAALYSKE